MSEIDTITDKLSSIFRKTEMFGHLVPILKDLGESAKMATETLRSDTRIIEIWPRFVGASDRIFAAKVNIPKDGSRKQYALGKRGLELIADGATLIISHSNSRMPMPKSTSEFLERCNTFKKKYDPELRK
jgi:hypothetical protein